MLSIHGFSQSKIKRLLYDLLINSSFELYSIETIRCLIELNHLNKNLIHNNENKNLENDSWLNNEQIRLVTHKLYSNKIYYEIFIPLMNGDCHEKRTIQDLLTYLDNIQLEQEQLIDVQDIKTKLTILP
jgi:hypothetical protein